jgi:Cof subfamily protein (haloacid dehalogenase superfamily)
MIKLIAIDLDGTLLRNDKSISDENKLAIQLAKSKGIKVVITTGRPLKAIQHILKELDLNEKGDYAITFNGGLIQKNDTGEIIDKKALTFEEIQSISNFVKPFDLPLDILSNEHVYQLPSSRKSWYNAANPYLTFSDTTIESLNQSLVFNKIVAANVPTLLDDALKRFPQNFKTSFEIIKSRDMLLEFMPKGVTKAFGLEKLGKHLLIQQSEMMAIGDEENDLSMIQYAGVGVAMGNAVELVKKVANLFVSTNEENGVAEAIFTVLPNK